MDIGDVPVVRMFTHKGLHYVYDLYKNQVLNISHEHYKELLHLHKIGIGMYKKLASNKKPYIDIIALISCGYFSSSKIDEIKHPYDEKLKFAIERFMQDMILQVTQKCNFNCRYCLYSGNIGVERNHSNRDMDWSTAKKSVDYLRLHSLDSEIITIGFYGGEPFLNFPLIERITEYVSDLFVTKQVNFITTTNGSLLSDEIIHFLVKHSFSTLISLDGTPTMHNKTRKMRLDGSDTFGIIFKNLKKIMLHHPKYFERNITINSVLSDEIEVKEAQTFFIENGIPKEKIIFNKTNLSGLEYISSGVLDGAYKISKEEANYGLVFDPDKNEAYALFKKKLSENSTIPKKWHHDGQCIPLSRRLFVTASGNLYPCEKIIENDAFCFGNIDCEEISINKIRKLLNIGKLSENECKKCWAIRFCEMCISHCLDAERKCLSSATKAFYCELTKKKILGYMKMYVEETE